MRWPVRRLDRHDLQWTVAFLAACLALVALKVALDARSRHDAVPRPRAATTAPSGPTAPDPTTGPFARLWSTRPTQPAPFHDSHLVRPTAAVAQLLAGATTTSPATAWPPLTNGFRLGALAGFLTTCDDIDDLRPACVVSPSTGTDPTKVAVLLGDSTMNAYWFMLRDALLPEGWTVVNFSLSDCPAALLAPTSPTSPTSPPACSRHHDAYERIVTRWKPSLVLMADGEDRVAGRARYAAALTRAVQAVSAPGRSTVLLSPPPVQPSIPACQSGKVPPQRCQQPPYATWFALNRIDRRVAARTGAVYADLLDLFCHDLVCPSVVMPGGLGLAVRGDFSHITPEYAQSLAPSMRRYLGQEGLLG